MYTFDKSDNGEICKTKTSKVVSWTFILDGHI